MDPKQAFINHSNLQQNNELREKYENKLKHFYNNYVKHGSDFGSSTTFVDARMYEIHELFEAQDAIIKQLTERIEELEKR
jgi:hypothetical protein